MPFVFHSKQFGEVSFETTWAMGQVHIGLLVGGGYAHISGHPLSRKEDGLAAIPPGPEQDAFLEWWENKDKQPIQEITRRIIVNPDGAYSFDDGTPIEKAEQLIGYFGSGDALEQALRWFARELIRREEIEKARASKAGGMGTKAKADKPKPSGAKKTGSPAQAPPETTAPPEVSIKE